MNRPRLYILLCSIAILGVTALLVSICIQRLHTSAYYRYTQFRVVMPETEVRQILGPLWANAFSCGTGGTTERYETPEGTLTIHLNPNWGEDGVEGETLGSKVFAPRDSSSARWIRWLIDMGL